ncbi:SDR family NAD(P)-dependent oxidoreductase [Nocardioidaceae bacterium]|nr:SDR family NAD(P)-dependent oxidoreductase [Nocardioidaceae bacterium]
MRRGGGVNPLGWALRSIPLGPLQPLKNVAGSPVEGQRILVTGASSGVGEATARQLAAKGAEVWLVARRLEELQRVATEIEAAGGSARVSTCDLSDLEQVDALVAEVLEAGGVDVLVNNAGKSIRRSLELSFDRFHDFERMMAINYFGPVRLTMGLLPSMIERGDGHVVNVLTWGVQGLAPKFAAYTAAKAALDAFGRIASRELRHQGVTVTNVRLDLVRTPMIAPTDAFDNRPARSPEGAARMLVRACEDRPPEVNTLLGTLGAISGMVAPRVSDLSWNAVDRQLPDSKAARGDR